MKIATRVGVFLAAGLIVCGSTSAAHATVAPSPEATSAKKPSTALADASKTPSPGLSETDISGENTNDADESTVMDCAKHVTDSEVVIEFEPPVDFDKATVVVAGAPVDSKLNGSTVAVKRADATDTMLVDLWVDKTQHAGKCEVSPPPKPSPSDSASDDQGSTGTKSPAEPSPTGPKHSPTPQPSDTRSAQPSPDPTPHSSAPSSPSSEPATRTPPTPSTRPSSPEPTPDTQTRSPTEQDELSPLPSAPKTSSGVAQPPHTGRPPTTPEQRGPRDIRPFSDSPRYLLPQLLGVNPNQDSPLIMPREDEQQSTDLETLPPISEDELDAIKAQLESPGRADQAVTGEEVEGAEIDERLAERHSGWLLFGISAVVGIGAGLWWAIVRRIRRNH